MHCLLSDLLYYDISQKKHSGLKKGLKEYLLLLSALVESLEAFESGSLEKFDSLVGENACQIRAIQIALIHSTYSSKDKLKTTILQCKKTISEILKKKINSFMANGISLKDLLASDNLEISLDQTEAFLLKSYLLCEMKEVFSDSSNISLTRQEKCSPSNLKKLDKDISCSFSKKLASHLRQKLSKISVEFVQQAAENLEDSFLIKKVSNSFVCTYNSLHSLPMYWTYKVLLTFAKLKKIPLIAHIKCVRKQNDKYVLNDTHHLFFRPTEIETGEIIYVETSPNSYELDTAACVIEGVALIEDSWNKEILTESITNSILAGAADHRQYPNPDHFPLEDIEYKEFKSLAKKKGFSIENPTTFLINHVYAAKTRSVVI